VNNQVPVVVEPPNAQAIYAVMDGPMGAVLTQPNANIPQLLKDANAKIQTILSSLISRCWHWWSGMDCRL